MKMISRKRRHELMLAQGMHSGNTDAKFDPPPQPHHPRCPCKPAPCIYPTCTCAIPSKERGTE